MLQSSASSRQTEPSCNTSKAESMFLVIYKTSSTPKVLVYLHLIYYCRGKQFSSIIKLRWSFKTFTMQLYTFAELYIWCVKRRMSFGIRKRDKRVRKRERWGSDTNPEYQCSMSEGSQSCSAPKPERKRDDIGSRPCRVKTA